LEKEKLRAKKGSIDRLSINRMEYKWRAFCCQGPAEPRLTAGNGQEFKCEMARAALRGEGNLSFIVVICNYICGPDNGGTTPGKKITFTRPSILFRPHKNPPDFPEKSLRAYGGGAGYRPRVRSAYSVSVYRHSRCDRHWFNIVMPQCK